MPTTNCPSRDEFFAFAVGTLPEDRAEEVFEHLGTCAICRATLEAIDEGADTLVARLRRPAAKSPYAAEPHREELLGRLRAMVPVSDQSGGLPPPMSMACGELGEYQLLEKLGEGGMGAVYKARQTRLKKTVALKVLPKKRMEDPKAVARFEREMEAIGQLNHPNIIQAYDAREIEGTPVLVTEYVEGLDLSELVHRVGPFSIPNACELIRQAAIGLQYAHERGLVHRDIKPSNLMLAAVAVAPGMPSIPADDTRHVPAASVKILDLGLALLPGSGEKQGGELTGSGQLMGTLNYMAPEQGMHSHDVDIRADVYSLGATLYKLLCDRAPFEGAEYSTPVQMMMALATASIVPIAERRRDLPEGLVAVLDRMLARLPADRFSTAAEVCDAMQPFTAGCDLAGLLHEAGSLVEPPVEIDQSHIATDEYHSSALVGTQPAQAAPPRPASLWERIRARAGRHPVTAAITAGLLPLLVVLGIVIWIERDGCRARLETPNESQISIDRQGDVTVRLPGEASAANVRPLTIGPPVKVEPLELRMEPAPDTWSHLAPGQPLSAMALVQAPAKIAGLRSWTLETVGHRGTVRSVAYSPDGRLLATGCGDGVVRIWDVAAEKVVRGMLGHDGAVNAVSWSPAGDYLASASDDRTVRLWSPGTGRLIRTLRGHAREVVAAAWSPKATAVASGDAEGVVWHWDVGQRAATKVLKEHKNSITALAWSPHGERLASAARDNKIIFWRPDTAVLERQLSTDYVEDLAWSPDGKTLASSAHAQNRKGKAISLWDAETGKLRETMSDIRHGVRRMAWSADGESLLLSSNLFFWTVCTWRLAAQGPALEIGPLPIREAMAVDYAPDGESMVAGGVGSQVVVYETRSGRTEHSLPAHRSDFTTAAVSPDGQRLAAGNGWPGICVWDLCSGEMVFDWWDSATIAPRVSLSPDGQRLAASAYPRGSCEVYDLANRRRRWSLETKHVIVAQAWSPDGARLATACWGQRGCILDVATGKRLLEIPASCGLSFSPNGNRLAAVAAGLIIYDAQTAKAEFEPKCPDQISTTAWSADGAQLACGTTTGDVLLLDASSGQFRHRLEKGHKSTVETLQWGTDGQSLISGTSSEWCVWDLKSLSLLRTRPGHCLAVSPREPIVICGGASLVRLRHLYDGHVLCSLAVLRDRQQAVIGADGHFRGTPRVDNEFVYVVLTDSGEQVILTAEEFSRKHGWKNDPSKAVLAAEIANPKGKEDHKR